MNWARCECHQLVGVERMWGRRRIIMTPVASEGHPMKWAIRVELTPDGIEPIT
jgi:hypothetical protein